MPYQLEGGDDVLRPVREEQEQFRLRADFRFRIQEHLAQLPAQRAPAGLARHQHLMVQGTEHVGEVLNERGFARACRADDAYVFSRLYVQTYVVKRVKISSGIAECEMAVLDIPANVVDILCTVLVRYFGNFVEQCADSSEGRLSS